MKFRILLVITVSIFIISATVLLINYAKGYRPDLETGGIKATGLLVATSKPEGAHVFIDGELKTATDDTLDLDPGDYSVEIKKDGFIPWRKRLKVQKELVTQTDAVLFPITPNLQSVTNSGVLRPSLSPSGTKLLYVISEDNEATSSSKTRINNTRLATTGLWLMELTNLPLGFNQDPKQLVVGVPRNLSWSDAEFIWSPDSREILAVFYKNVNTDLIKKEKGVEKEKELKAVYLINTGNDSFQASQLKNIASKYEDLLAEWQEEAANQLENKIRKLPAKFADLLATTSSDLRFSPDETKLLYTASTSAQLMDEYISPVPSASTQAEDRKLKEGQTYVYDLKEDRNFMMLDKEDTIKVNECPQTKIKSRNLLSVNDQLSNNLNCSKLDWFPTSRHLVYFNEGKITIMEYDGTNQPVIYAGPIEQNYVFPHPSSSKLLIVTNLNPDSFPFPNIYTLSLR